MNRSYWQEIKIERNTAGQPVAIEYDRLEAQLAHDHSVVVRTRAEHARTFSDIYNRKL